MTVSPARHPSVMNDPEVRLNVLVPVTVVVSPKSDTRESARPSQISSDRAVPSVEAIEPSISRHPPIRMRCRTVDSPGSASSPVIALSTCAGVSSTRILACVPSAATKPQEDSRQ